MTASRGGARSGNMRAISIRRHFSKSWYTKMGPSPPSTASRVSAAARMGGSPLMSRNSRCSSSPCRASTWHDHWKTSCWKGFVPLWAGTKPFQQLVFQWSCHVEARHGELEHLEFLDTSGEPPMRAAAETLLAVLGGEGPIFVYHDFEKWRLMEMARLFPDLAPPLEAVMGRLVDLLRLTRDHYRH